jgi:hypothetical protein
MTPTSVARCVCEYVARHVALLPLADWKLWLSNPARAWQEEATRFTAALQDAGVSPAELSAYVREMPYLLLRNTFACEDLPATPQDWVPIPETAATRGALAAAVLLAGACGMEAVSYGAENEGALFVNLVTLPGTGALAEKSQGNMRGHTDAATFPFRGTRDPDFPRIAPSPDLVFLAALRNVDAVPTVVMPLAGILQRLSPEDLALLKGPNIVLGTQRTFMKGTKDALGEAHVVDGGAVLHDGPEGTWVRYTHSQSVVLDEDNAAAVAAKKNFEDACMQVAEQIVLQPGDLLIVNNRKALHGRATVGPAIGGESRWLIRGYGLDCSELPGEQRHAQGAYKLFP